MGILLPNLSILVMDEELCSLITRDNSCRINRILFCIKMSAGSSCPAPFDIPASIVVLHNMMLSTRLAIQINEAETDTELDQIEGEMIHKYCLLVRNHSMKNYSQLTQRCITYIDFHYAEPLSLSFFADMCHVTKSYLSTLFKKETDTNITDYIHSVRIRHALVLLNSTALPIHAIAASCGYSDINYFIKIFKRLNGNSPKQYRSQMTKT